MRISAGLPTRVAQGGVALGLVLSMGAVVVTADGGERTGPTTSVVDGDLSLARAAADRAAAATTAQMRVEAVEAAQVAVDEVSRVRSDAAQAAVPDDALAELDAATAALQEAIEGVDGTALLQRSSSASRSSERTEPAATTTPDAAALAATAETAGPPAPTTPAPTTEAPTTEASAPDAPLTSDAPAVDPATPADRLAGVTLPDTADPATTPLRAALDRVKQAAEAVLTTTEQKKAEAAAAQAAAEEAARLAAEQAAQRAAWKASLRGYANGNVPASALCALSFDRSALLRCDAAEALEGLDAAFVAEFGTHMDISDTYRSYSAQVACRAAKGNMCAAPGTSNHGMGVAVDLGGRIQTFGTAQHQWMRENAPAFQWTLPDWARAGGSKPEPWHWEYVG
ncbi:M15 family metallopeptidase [Cellulomonas sp. S1-8]|uniref:M15 family metallopeptidase n=1 Tax=Cellulomonas sp. S1-8 TaxID=2904790 RepID=UPI002243B4A1|nr:M15 family metallopeptidase [Cellulomonas sp. S1-8]UZN03991.1 M15 family metallopeptidase [Cellulomonas sp. S1-8]